MLTLFSGPHALLARFATAGLVVLAIFGYGWFKGHSSAQTAFDEYRGKVEALGDAQAKRTAEIIKSNQAKKEAADAKLTKRIAALNTDNDRLRSLASASSLPARAPDTRCPEGWACFDRASLESAIRQLDAGVSGIVEKGDTLRLRMDEAIRYSNRLN